MSSAYKNASPFSPAPVTSFHFNYLLKGPISQHISPGIRAPVYDAGDGGGGSGGCEGRIARASGWERRGCFWRETKKADPVWQVEED